MKTSLIIAVITETINHVSISLSAAQIYDLSYIHLLYLHHLLVYNELTKWPVPCCLDSSVDRELHWYRRGHGSESRSNLNFLRL